MSEFFGSKNYRGGGRGVFLFGGYGVSSFFFIWGGGIFTFFKLTGSGGHHNCFLGGGFV